MGQRRLTLVERKALRDYIDAAKYLNNSGIEIGYEAAEQFIKHDTSNGLPYIEPELTLEDVKNKTWVMVKDWNETNHIGPYRLAAITKSESNKYVVLESDYSWGGSWSFARRATRKEIEAAGINEVKQ
jgi:hypothetical protein